MGTLEDIKVGRAVIDLALATPDQVRDALILQGDLESVGPGKTLEEILFGKGILTPQTREKVRQHLAASTRPPRIGNYEILGVLGKGGMGTVYRARQVSQDRIVAMKLLDPSLARDREFLGRFYREAQAARLLSHPNLVKAVDLGELDGFHFLAMEFVNGEGAGDLLRRLKVLPVDRVLDIGIQVARALDFAHRHNFIHRDVKPDNILIDGHGMVRLTDLGLVKAMVGPDPRLTLAGAAVGTPTYISPEQARADADVDKRTDLYSLGATLYHLATGFEPHAGDTAAVVMMKHVTEDPIPPQQRNPGIPEDLDLAIRCMMSRDREKRYSDASRVLEDLDHIRSGEPAVWAREILSGETGEPAAGRAADGKTARAAGRAAAARPGAGGGLLRKPRKLTRRLVKGGVALSRRALRRGPGAGALIAGSVALLAVAVGFLVRPWRSTAESDRDGGRAPGSAPKVGRAAGSAAGKGNPSPSVPPIPAAGAVPVVSPPAFPPTPTTPAPPARRPEDPAPVVATKPPAPDDGSSRDGAAAPDRVLLEEVRSAVEARTWEAARDRLGAWLSSPGDEGGLARHAEEAYEFGRTINAALAAVLHGAAPNGMVYVPPGEFDMGGLSDEAQPVHRVYVEGYFIDATEVTCAAYAAFLADADRHEACHPKEPKGYGHAPDFWNDPKWRQPDLPVVGVSWFDAFAFAASQGKRLPAEAEWERAARGLDGRPFSWGETWDFHAANCPDRILGKDLPSHRAWTSEFYGAAPWKSRGLTVPVGTIPGDRSPVGCMDMLGNALEWCEDWLDDGYYRRSPRVSPPGPGRGEKRVLRGRSWYYPVRNAQGTVTYLIVRRDGTVPAQKSELGLPTRGFRCVKDAVPHAQLVDLTLLNAYLKQ